MSADFVTQCPNCATAFNITHAQLNAAEGAVRCGACLTIFDGQAFIATEAVEFDAQGQQIEAEELVVDEQAVQSLADVVGPEIALAEPARSLLHTQADRVGPAEIQIPVIHVESNQTAAELMIAEPMATALAGVTGLNEPADSTETTENITASVAQDVSVEVRVMGPEQLNSVDQQDAFESAAVAAVNEPEVDALVGPALVDPALADNIALAGPRSDSVEADSVTADSVTADSVEALEDLSPLAGFELEFELDADEPEVDVVESEPSLKLASILKYLGWCSFNLLLLLLLLGQYLWFNMHSLSQDISLRSYYIRACEIIDCQLQEFQNVQALTATDLVIRSHQGNDNALIIDAIVKNAAPYRQLLPRLKLRFRSINGRILASRKLLPAEYLGGEMVGLRFIPANTEIRLSLEIVDPGIKAVSYSLVVLAP
ncbi:MAG: DUF3426 domain-containing protein [Pseudomonadales bacterium]|nr:DUF3426 domain-containing protein [Pseudomonadales bacterium]